MRAPIAAAALTALCLAAATPVAAANPIVEPVAADPSIVRADDGTYYMYTTADDWGDGEGTRQMAIFESTNLVDWEEAGNVFDQRPDWIAGDAGLWAPDVHLSNGQYSLYYSVGGNSNPCIGLATSPSPTGPWTDLGHEVFCANDLGIGGTIDPFVWDENGSKTMFVGNFKGIFAVPLSADGTAPDGDPIQVADKRFEAAYVKKHAGYYYLFVSAGHCCKGPSTAYRVIVGRSQSLTGPYVDRKGEDLNSGGGALILAGDDKWAGPGHNAVVTDDAGDDWIVYHATPRNDMELPSGVQRREGLLDKIVWANGWPEVGDGSPSSTRPAVPDIEDPETDVKQVSDVKAVLGKLPSAPANPE